jgi:hypothetical protein
MANQDNPHGLLALYVLSGGPIQTDEFNKLVGLNSVLYPGDVVAQVDSGRDISVPATPGTTLITGVNLNYAAALTASVHTVIVGLDTVFEAQGDNGTALDLADMGLNCNLIYNAGNATSKKSGHEIDASEKATNAAYDVKLLKKLAVPDNEYGEFARIEILINKSRLAQGAAGV